MLVEAVCCSVDDALSAERAGAGRIELCSAIELGGLTPSSGLVREARRHCGLPAVAMVRPRAGGFAYTASEVETMAVDVAHLAEEGVEGLVVAALRPDGLIDEEACRIFKQAAGDVYLVFHRAFDATPDLFESLELLIRLGFRRILTSGGAESALEGLEVLRKLVDQSAGRIEILPAGGIRVDNAATILRGSGANQLHLGPMRDVVDATAPFYGVVHRALDEFALKAVVEAVGIL